MNRFQLATFRVMSPDEPTGGAAVAEGEEKDAFDTLMGNGLGILDTVDSVFSEEEVPAGEGAEGGDPKPGDETPTGDPPAVPESLDVDGTPVPVADLLEAYKSNEANAEIIELGNIYHGTREAFNSGPDGARAVVEAMMEAVRSTYGEEALAGLGVADALPEGFKEEDLTENELALYRQNRALERRLNEQSTNFQRTLDELQPVVEDRRLQAAGDAYAATVNAQFPTANVDAKSIVAMMKETGLDDPVKAYKLATYDAKAADAAVKKAEETKPANTMPRQGAAAKTFDPNDKTLTADRMVDLLKQGYRPVSA